MNLKLGGQVVSWFLLLYFCAVLKIDILGTGMIATLTV